MVLSVDRKVEVKPGVIAPVTSANIQNCLLLSNKDKFINHEVREFSSAAEVGEVFGSGSKEENFAKTYFQSYVGSVKRPEKLLIGENYSLQARPASVTSTFFDPNEEPELSIQEIGGNEPQSSVVRSNIMPVSYENSVVQELNRFGTENPSPSYISSLIFEPQYDDATLEDCFQLLNEIGEDGENFGDFTVIFSHENDPIRVTADNINLSEAQDIGNALEIITNAINDVIVANQNLGENYKVELFYDGNNDAGFTFVLEAVTPGSQYTINSVFSTVPAVNNICHILGLADNENPVKQPGMDKMYGDFLITFEVNGQNIIATADKLDFTKLYEINSQIRYLESEVNTAIGNTENLGDNYKVRIQGIILLGSPEVNDVVFIVSTVNKGSDYSIVNITGNVASTLGLTKDNNASFYPGTDKKYGDFSVVFNVNNEKIIATASNLDFTSYSTLEDQLSYLTTKINEVISTNEKLGANFTVKITKNNLSGDFFNVSLTTTGVGEMYQIDSIFSVLPLGSFLNENVASILKLAFDDRVKPTVINGTNSFPLSNVLDKYANDRSDWWSVSITESSINTYNDISDWVNAKNDGCRYVFIAHDKNELANTTTANPNTFGFSVYQSGKKATTTVFGDERLAGFVAGTAASIDYERTNGTITFSGRRQNGMEITANTDKEANCLESNYYNYYGSYSSTNPKYRFFENGIVSGSDGQNWLDSLFNQIWLLHELQNAMFNLLLDKNKLPFNKNSYALISDCCDAVALKAVDCGVISPGVNLDEQQIVIVNEAVGKDVSENLYSYGYYLYIGDNSSSERQKRTAKNCILFYCDGGAIQKIKFIANVLL